MPDGDGCVRLLAAVARQWASDARKDANALYTLAAWLGDDVNPNQLYERLAYKRRCEL